MIPSGLNVVLDRGLAVFPCRERTVDAKRKEKAPLTKHGVKDASTDHAQIAEWARKHPDCAWGAAMTDEIAAIDIDVKRGVDGFHSYATMVAEHDDLPPTLTNATPSGGEHRLFEVGRRFRNKSAIAPGVDIRSAGGYIVIPPSTIETGRYRWRDAAAEIARAPSWFIEQLAHLASKNAKVPSSGPDPRTMIPEGQRNDTLYWHTRNLRARGIPKDEAWVSVQLQNRRCVPPLADAELAQLFGSAWERVFSRNDTGNAQRFLDAYRPDVRYVPAWREWITWGSDERWAPEPEALGCIARVKQTIVTALGTEVADLATPADQQAHAKWLIQSQNMRRLEDAVRNARSEPGVRIDARLLDANRYLIGTQNGTLDLRDGSHRPAQREDWITKRLGCAFDPKATAPKWQAFLTMAAGGDATMQTYLQQIVGLSLLGNLYRLVIFIYGPTATGKSVFLEVIKALFSDYAKAAATDLLMQGSLRTKHGPTEALARLAGARLVTVSETNSSDTFDEALLKDLTGRDVISARHLNKGSFEFRPDFTIWIRGNHKPRFSGDDAAMLERLRLIPFTRQVPERERNPGLLDEIIAAELPGVLNWALVGALAVLAQQSVTTPAVVREATREYAQEMDSFGQFIGERCELAAARAVRAGLLYAAYQNWCTEQGLHHLSRPRVWRKLAERGVTRANDMYGVTYRGIALRQGMSAVADEPCDSDPANELQGGAP